MTIAIDCRMLDASGVGVYLGECLAFFLGTAHHFLLFGDTKKLAFFVSGRHNGTVVSCAIPPFSVRELLFFPRALIQEINRSDAYFSPYFNMPCGITVPVYTTIHDIIFADMPELTSKIGLAARMWFLRRAFRRSKKVFTVSEFSKSRIVHHLGGKTPVVVAYNGCRNYFAMPGDGLKKTDDIVFAGNIKKHKGLSVLLRAFFMARAEGLQNRLVIVGEKDHFRSSDHETLTELEKADSTAVCFTGRLPDSALKTLLTQSALLVQPSLYEGFGLPPLEALFCGTKALISDIPVFKEIYRDFPVVFFKAGDSGDLKEKVMALLYEKEPEPVRLSADLRARYTYEKTASIIMREMTAG